MHASLAILTFLAAAVQAQVVTPAPCSPCATQIAAVPSCANECILSAAETNAGCAYGDYNCQCTSSAVIQNAAFNCVLSDCGLATGISVLNAVASVCTCVDANGCGAAAATPTA